MKSVSDTGIACACKGCTKRYVGCHAECPDYKDFVERNEKAKERIKIEKMQNNGWAYGKRRRK